MYVIHAIVDFRNIKKESRVYVEANGPHNYLNNRNSSRICNMYVTMFCIVISQIVVALNFLKRNFTVYQYLFEPLS